MSPLSSPGSDLVTLTSGCASRIGCKFSYRGTMLRIEVNTAFREEMAARNWAKAALKPKNVAVDIAVCRVYAIIAKRAIKLIVEAIETNAVRALATSPALRLIFF